MPDVPHHLPGKVRPETLVLADFRPKRQVLVRESSMPLPQGPVIDVHNHLGRWLSDSQAWIIPDVSALVATMDECSIETVVNLDGRWGAELEANLERYDQAHPGRFITFCHLDWRQLANPRGFDALAKQLARAAAKGAKGVKVWKDLGLTHRDATGDLVLPDDPRLDDAFAAAGDLGLPVLIHTADPIAFFDPLDGHNERLEELAGQPDWWFGGPDHPTFERLLNALEGRLRRSPGTIFIGAHVGCVAEDLDRVSRLLTENPNFVVDLGGRMAEIGRQPRTFRRLVEAHPTRVLFGTDAYPVQAEDYRLWFRFLESDDECFDYAPDDVIPPQGRWTVSAVDLPDELLAQVYRTNAHRVLGLS